MLLLHQQTFAHCDLRLGFVEGNLNTCHTPKDAMTRTHWPWDYLATVQHHQRCKGAHTSNASCQNIGQPGSQKKGSIRGCNLASQAACHNMIIEYLNAQYRSEAMGSRPHTV